MNRLDKTCRMSGRDDLQVEIIRSPTKRVYQSANRMWMKAGIHLVNYEKPARIRIARLALNAIEGCECRGNAAETVLPKRHSSGNRERGQLRVFS